MHRRIVKQHKERDVDMDQPLRKHKTETEQCMQDLTEAYNANRGLPASMRATASIDLIVQNEGLVALTSDGIMTSAAAPYISAYLDQTERAGHKIPYEVRNAILGMENSLLDSNYGKEGSERIKDRVLNMGKVLPFRKTSAPDSQNAEDHTYSNGWLNAAAATRYT